MTDNARIKDWSIFKIPPKFARYVTFLETELAAAKAREAGLTKALAEVQADLERAREALRATPCAPHDELDGFICLRCAALAPEQKG